MNNMNHFGMRLWLLSTLFIISISLFGQAEYVQIDGTQYTQSDTLSDCQLATLNFSLNFSVGDTAYYQLNGNPQDTVITPGQGISKPQAFGNAGSIQQILFQFKTLGTFTLYLKAYDSLSVKTLDQNNLDSIASICSGNAANIIITASIEGGKPSGQYVFLWQRADDFSFNLNPQDVAGATSNTYNTALEGNLFQNRFLRVGVIDSCVSNTITWGTPFQIQPYIPLSINPLRSASNASQFNEEVCFNSNLGASLQIDDLNGNIDGDYYYDWEWSNDANFQTILGTQASTNNHLLLPSTVGPLTDTTFFRVTVSDDCSDTLLSTTYTAFVSSEFELGLVQYSNTSIEVDTLCYSTTVSSAISVDFQGGRAPYSFLWQWDVSSNFNSPNSFPNSNNDPILTPTEVGTLDTSIFIRCVGTDSCGDSKVSSNAFTFVVHPKFAASNISTSNGLPFGIICNGDVSNGQLEFSTQGGNPAGLKSFQWFSSSSSNFSTASQIPGATDSILLTSVLGPLAVDTYLWGMSTDLNCGDTALTDAFLLEVYAPLSLTALHKRGNSNIFDEEVCFNDFLENGLEISHSGGNDNGNYYYQWQWSKEASFAQIEGDTLRQNSNILPSSWIGRLKDSTYFRVFLSDDCQDTLLSNVYLAAVSDSLSLSGTSDFLLNGSDTICYNEMISSPLFVSHGGGSTGHSYYWEKSADASFSSTELINGINQDQFLQPQELGAIPSSVFVRSFVVDACGDTAYATSSYYIHVYPELTPGSISPNAGLPNICFGRLIPTDLSFSPSGGDPNSVIEYHWLRSDYPLIDSATSILGKTDTILTVAELGPLLKTAYIWANMVDPLCNDSTFSAMYTINVYDELMAIQLHKTGFLGTVDEEVCHNDSLELGLELTYSGGNVDDDFNFYWQWANDSTFNNLIGSLTTTNVNTISALGVGALTDTTFFRVLISDGCSDTLTSNTYTAFVSNELILSETLGLTSTSDSDTICFQEFINEPLNAVRNGGRGTFTYQWQISSNANFNSYFTLVSADADSVLTPNELGALDSSIFVRAVVSDICNDERVSIAPYYIHVYDELIAGDVTAIQSIDDICYGRELETGIYVQPTGGDPAIALEYQWFIGSNDNFAQATPIPLATNDTLFSDILGPLTFDTHLWARVNDPSCSDTSLSGRFFIPVYDSLLLNELSSSLQTGNYSEDICFGDSIQAALLVTHTGGNTDSLFYYDWEWAIDSTFAVLDGGIYNSTSNSISPGDIGALYDTTYVRSIVRDECGDSLISNLYSVWVDDALILGPVTQLNSSISADTSCYGDLLNASVTASLYGGRGPYVYDWQLSSDSNFTSFISINTDNDDAILSPSELGNLFTSQFLRVVVSDGCGDDVTSSHFYSITIFDELLSDSITTSSGNPLEVVCHSDTIQEDLIYSFSGGNPQAVFTYQWFQSTIPNQQNAIPISGATTTVLSPTTLGPLTQEAYLWARTIDPSCGDTTWSSMFDIPVYKDLTIDSIFNWTSNFVIQDSTCLDNSFPEDSLWIVPRGGDTLNKAFSYKWLYAIDSNFQQIDQVILSNQPWLGAYQLSANAAGHFYLKARIFDNSCNRDSSDSEVIQVYITEELNGGALAFSTNGLDSIEICFEENTEVSSRIGDAPRGGFKELNPADYSYAYQWQIKSSNSSNFSDIIGAQDSSLLANADKLLQPGDYEYRLRISDLCGDFYSDTIHLRVNPSPYFDSVQGVEPFLEIIPLDSLLLDSNGNMSICDNQQNLPIRLASDYLGSLYRYDWSTTENIPHSPFEDGQPIFQSLEHIPSVDSAFVQLEISSVLTDCSRFVSRRLSSTGHIAPDAAEIQPKNLNTTRILLAEVDRNIQDTLFFKWGRIDRQTAELYYLSNWDTLKYHQFVDPIDTAGHTYFVANTFDTTSSCRSFAFFPTAIKAISSDELMLPSTGFKLFPNPSAGIIQVQGDIVSVRQISAIDLSGRAVKLEWVVNEDRIRIKISDYRGFLVVNIQTDQEVFHNKVLIE